MKSFYLLAAFLLATAAQAQQPWDTNVMGWTAPTTCTSGQPIANCPVTGYRVERSATASGTYAAVGTTAATVTQFAHTGAATGLNCYRVIALSAKGDSGPTAPPPLCFMNSPPSGPPNPPTNLVVIAPLAFNIRMEGHDVVLAQQIGKAKLGAACGSQCFDGYCPVARSNVKLTTAQPAGAVMVARCG